MIGDLWYRVEDYLQGQGYVDVHGEYVSTGASGRARLIHFWVVRETPKGVWLTYASGNAFSLIGHTADYSMPEEYRGRTFKEWKESRVMPLRFVLYDSNKRFACSTLAEAVESFRSRKNRQRKILLTRLRHIDESLTCAEKGDFQ